MTKKQDIFLLFILYSFSSIFLLLNFDGVYWDDWVAVNQTQETINIFMGMIQHGLKGVFVKLMLSFENQIYPSRIFLFFTYFITGILLYYILNTIKELSKKDIFYITLLYLIMPVSSSKIAISIIPFYLPLLIFFISFILLTKYIKNNSFLLRVIILLGFFISFDTNSILVFYATVLMYIFYIKYNFQITISNIKSFTFRYIDFILLPIIFFIIKSIYFKPYGLYEGYNSLADSSIFKVIFKLFRSIDTSIFNVLHQSFYISLPYWLLIFVITFIFIKRNWIKNEKKVNTHSKEFLYLGFIFFFLAIFPYVAVLKLPTVESFSSRFQLLTPLGLAFIFYFGINMTASYFKSNRYMKPILLILLVCSFMGKNLYDYYKWQIDSLYMTSIMMNLKDDKVVKNNTTFIINNNIIPKLMYQRTPPLYEWNGILKQAFGDDKRLIVSYQQSKKLDSIIKLQHYLQYNFSQWKQTEPILLTISKSYKYKVGKTMISKLLLMRFKDYKQYLIEVKKLTTINTNRFMEKR
ncbi:MAG TPA: hypothetical protein EYG73_10500 [Arcobacter sp.]|nr:hypothetical protein [Arcobacter sp.]